MGDSVRTNARFQQEPGFQWEDYPGFSNGKHLLGADIPLRRAFLWTVKADLTWGMTDNCMESRFSNGMDAHGEWNNRTWLVQAEVSRSIQYAGGWTVSPFLRMEFTHGTEASFLEDGSYARKFEGAVCAGCPSRQV